jgi:fibronectin-binding autotransporter adhesin
MKPKHLNFLNYHHFPQSVLLVGIITICLGTAPAANNIYWDGPGGTLWSTATSWNLNVDGTGADATVPSSSDIANFSTNTINSAQTINLNAPQSAAGLVFLGTNTATTTLQSSTTTTRALTLGTSGITVNSGAGAVTIGSSTNAVTITLAGAQSWTNNSANVFTETNAITNAGFLLTIAGTGNTTINGVLGGTGGLTKIDSGTLTFGGVNTFTGPLIVAAGTLSVDSITNAILSASTVTLGSTGATGTLHYKGTGSTTNPATRTFILATGGIGEFIVDSGNLLPTSGVISGGGSLTKSGSGTLNLSGANTYTGNTLISAGTLTLANNAALQNSVLDPSGAGTLAFSSGINTPTLGGLTSASNLTLASNVTGLTLNPGTGTTNTYSGNLGSATAGMTLTMSGSGTQILSGTNTFTGATTLTSGTLSVGASANLGNANLLVFNGGTLQITGTTLNSYAAGMIGTHAVTQTAAKAIKFDIADAANNFTISQNLTQSTGGLTKSGAGTLTLTGTGNTFTGLTTVSAGTLAYGVANALNTGAVTVNGGVLSLGNYSDSVGIVTLASGSITGTGALTSTGTFEMQSGTVSAILGGASIALNKTTAGTVTLSGANTYTGLTTVTEGTLAYGIDNALSSGAVTVNGGTLDISTFSDSVGAVTLTSGSITGTSGVLSGTGYTLNGSGTVSAILGGASALTANTGVSTLTGANTFSGATTVTSGALNIQNATALGTNAAGTTVSVGASLQLQGGITVANEALTLSGLGNYLGALRNISGNNTYGGLVTLGATTRITSDADSLILSNTGTITGATFSLTVYGAGNTTINSIIGTTSGTLDKYDAGTLTLTGANTYTGATTVNVGVLNIQNNTAMGTTAGGVTVTSGAALQIQGNITVGAEALTLSGTGISNDGALRNISGNNTYGGLLSGLAGATRINSDADTLTFSNPGSWTGSGADLTVGGAGNTTINSVIAPISGSTLTKDGSGTLTLTGANSYAGTTTVNAGVLNIQNATALGIVGYLGTSVAAGAALQIQNNITVTTETLTLNGDGINNDGALRNSSGDNVLQATVTLGSASRINSDAGTLTFNTAANSITGTNQNLTLGGVGSGTVGGTITTGTGTLTKDGAGTWTLSGLNTYTGLTTVSQGTLAYGVTNALSSGAVTVNGGTLDIKTYTDTVGVVTLTSGSITGTGTGALTGTSFVFNGTGSVTAILAGTGAVSKTGAGTTTTLSGTNTYTGATQVDAGTLIVNGSLAAGSAVTVGSSGTLKGSGIIHGGLTVSGTLSPGNSPGVLTTEGTTTLNSGSVFEWELDTAKSTPETNRGVAYDGFNTSAVDGNGAIFKIVLTGTQDFSDTFWDEARSWTDIFKNAAGTSDLAGWTGAFSPNLQFSYNNKTAAPTSGSFSMTGNTLNWNYTAVPEPTSALAGLLLGIGMLRRTRRQTGSRN